MIFHRFRVYTSITISRTSENNIKTSIRSIAIVWQAWAYHWTQKNTQIVHILSKMSKLRNETWMWFNCPRRNQIKRGQWMAWQWWWWWLVVVGPVIVVAVRTRSLNFVYHSGAKLIIGFRFGAFNWYSFCHTDCGGRFFVLSFSCSRYNPCHHGLCRCCSISTILFARDTHTHRSCVSDALNAFI